MTLPDLSVAAVILNWNEPTRTLACVDSLRASAPGLSEIVVVDNGSQPALHEQLAASLRDATLLSNPDNRGYAAGLQTGVDHCLARDVDLIWLLNNDTSFSAGTFPELMASVARNGLNCIYAPRILRADGSGRELFNGRIFDYTIAGYRNLRDDDPRSYGAGAGDLLTEAVPGASFMVPSRIIRNHGFMSHDYYLYYEEFDYALRLRAHDVRCICVLNAVMYHDREGTRGPDPARLSNIRTYYRVRNKILFFKRCFPMLTALRCITIHLRQSLRKYRLADAAGRHIYAKALLHGLMGFSGRQLEP